MSATAWSVGWVLLLLLLSWWADHEDVLPSVDPAQDEAPADTRNIAPAVVAAARAVCVQPHHLRPCAPCLAQAQRTIRAYKEARGT